MQTLRWLPFHAFLIGFSLVSAVSAGEAPDQELYLPVVVNGYVQQPVHLQTMLRIVNLSSEPTRVVFEAFQNDGTPTRLFELFPVARDGTQTTFEIAGHAAVEAFTLGDIPDFNGWARLTFPRSARIRASAEVALINGEVGPHPICQRPSTEILATASVDAVAAGPFGSAFVVKRPHRLTAVAAVNPSPTQDATVRVSLLDLAGNLVASAQRQLGPRQRFSEPLSQLLPDAPEELMGILWTHGSGGAALGAIHLLFPEGEFATAPASTESVACLEVLSSAENPLTGECVVFPNSCIPVGWRKVESCPD